MIRLPKEVVDRAKALGLNWRSLGPSHRHGKRLQILHEGRLIHFGAWPVAEGTFVDHGNLEIRRNWRARHSKIMKNGHRAYMDPDSPSFYSWNLLW